MTRLTGTRTSAGVAMPAAPRSPAGTRQRSLTDVLAGPRARLGVGVAALLVTAMAARRSRVGAGEAMAFRAVNGLPDSVYPPAWAVMQLGAFGAAPAAAAVAWLADDGALARQLLASGTGTWALAKLVKQMVRRPRPAALLPGTRGRGREAAGLGYLSGHAGVAAALGAAAFPHLGPVGRALTLAAIPAVGATRVYVGAHLPLDIAGGAALGLAVEAAVDLAKERTRHTSLAGVPGALPAGRLPGDPRGHRAIRVCSGAGRGQILNERTVSLGVSAMPELRGLVRLGCLALAVACAGCTTATSRASRSVAQGPGAGHAVITVGSFNFPESVLLAYLYADTLAGKGYPVRVLPDLGTRELVDPALMAGLVQLVPEYTGSALEFVSLGRVHATANVAATASALATAVAGRGLVTGRPAAAQDGNAIVVTAATAARYQLRTISDLATVARRLVFGGPPECAERLYCLPGLRLRYGLAFREFVPLDADGPLTRQALTAGDINVALLFTTDPAIRARHLVVLADNRSLQPAENVVPVLRRATADRYGPGLLAALNALSARLSTAALTALDTQVELDGRAPGTVAERWLRAQRLAGPGLGSS